MSESSGFCYGELVTPQPQGGAPGQPRATPWVTVKNVGQALKGRANHWDLWGLARPFRAYQTFDERYPGRCPGLAWRAPLGLKPNSHEPYRGCRLRSTPGYLLPSLRDEEASDHSRHQRLPIREFVCVTHCSFTTRCSAQLRMLGRRLALPACLTMSRQFSLEGVSRS